MYSLVQSQGNWWYLWDVIFLISFSVMVVRTMFDLSSPMVYHCYLADIWGLGTYVGQL